MPLNDLVHHFNASGLAGEGTLYLEQGRAAAWFDGLRLRSLFQPIVELRSLRIVGHQAHLTVLSDTGLPLSTAAAYERQATPSQVIQFDRLCRTLHALNFLAQRRHAGGFLQIAVHPRHLAAVRNDHGLIFEAILKRCGLAPEDIILDVDLASAEERPPSSALANYRERGYRIALRASSLKLAQAEASHYQADQLVLPSRIHTDLSAASPARRILVDDLDNGALIGTLRNAGVSLASGPYFGGPAADCRATHESPPLSYNARSHQGAPQHENCP